jgi:hypothetical protein
MTAIVLPTSRARRRCDSDGDAEHRRERHREADEQHALRIGVEEDLAHRSPPAPEDGRRRGLAERALEQTGEVVLRAFPRLAEDVHDRRVIEACARRDQRDLREDDDENEREDDEENAREDRHGSATHCRSTRGMST